MNRVKYTYKHTMYACFLSYIVQAVVNSFLPLLFLTLSASYRLPLGQLTFLITVNFGVQLLIDLIAPTFVDRIGYKPSAVAGQLFSGLGLSALVFLPPLFAEPFYGLCIAVVLYALGGGLLEVLISPIVEATPSENKESAMSLLHSFYCWGQVGVVLLSTLFFALFGIENWRYAALLWALLPFFNAYFFMRVPVPHLHEDGRAGMSIRALLGNRWFWLLVLVMICAGASEHAVAQWASSFAEKALGVSKTLGDLTGPMFFALSMGLSRLLFSRIGGRLKLSRYMALSALLCIVSFLLVALSPWPALSLFACGLCGFGVGIMWPGTLSVSAVRIRTGGTAMFAYLALAGDLGCSLGPTLVGRVATAAGDNLKLGLLSVTVFPVILLLGILWLSRSRAE